ncbi:DUF4168 domain-containing protein [Legionella israelensis]|uniref:DUF4168 domain-containing protein n=1 Tax=Legionella israelensis TaxID=454 RepID=A0A0W0WEA8_9GAMM|nr:DUF4168 domain-containing protein [Legionella israelensis]KTD30701.1 hypothetical protein Lisr_0687 [Legionella israelensis]QBR82899.1 DUF4168 domain-containing protein [Legionella israelensis]QBS09826.1 DUF4168 domain-containing protein [Legionella israelensis]SCY13482.1 protein of unknown function [Legionella israelensis DSM 19235]STX59383.1 Uncharacterised protein [Legionella israelensis]
MKKIILLLSFITGFSFSILAAADTNTMQQTAPSNPSATKISEGDLNKFVKTYKELVQIQQKYQQKLQANQGKDAQQLEQKAYKEMNEAVKNNGLTPQQYNQIAQQIQQNPQLRKKIQSMQ